ncbi:MAG: hypothetical protein MJ250_04565 [Alphaproteobacteria bacterium]|nr:hypothetical protein [Alphaproteobacteria bacterium]
MRLFLASLLMCGIAGCSVLPFVGGESLPEPEEFDSNQETEDHQYASKQHENLRSGLSGLSISQDMYENLNYGDAVRTDPVEIRGLDVELPPEDTIIADAERDILSQDEKQVKQEIEEQRIAESVAKEEQKLEEERKAQEEQLAAVQKSAEEKTEVGTSAPAEEVKENLQTASVEQKVENVSVVQENPENLTLPVEQKLEDFAKKEEHKTAEEKVGQNVVAIAPVEVGHEVGKEHTSVVEGAFKEERAAKLKSADQIIEDKIKIEQAQQKKQEELKRKKAKRKAVKYVAKAADEIDVDALLANATDLNDEYVNQLVKETMNSDNTAEVNELLKHSEKTRASVNQSVLQQKPIIQKPVVKKNVVKKQTTKIKQPEKVKLKLKAPQQEVIKLKPLKRKLKIKETKKVDDDFDTIYID